eukprot:278720-Amphidinium_carterae.1
MVIVMRTQDCRPLKTKKHKKGRTFFLEETQATSPCGTAPVGEAAGGLSLVASEVRFGYRPAAAVESGNRLPAPDLVEPPRQKLPRQGQPARQEPISLRFLGKDLVRRIKASRVCPGKKLIVIVGTV